MSGASQVRYYRAWHGLAEFCGDCALATTCEIRGTRLARTCPLVREQRAEDLHTGRHRLLAYGQPAKAITEESDG